MTVNVKDGYRIASYLKGFVKKIIMGGFHASFNPEEASKYVDHVVVGEGDKIICDIVEGKYKQKIIKGGIVKNLDELPFIDSSLTKEKKNYLISTSRGCIYNY